MDKLRMQRMLSLGMEKQVRALSDEETQELNALRQEYLADFRESFRQQLEHIYLEQEDGSYRKLEQKAPDTTDME